MLRQLLAPLLVAAAMVAPAQAAPSSFSTQPVLRIETGAHLSPITRVSTDARGRFVVTASEDKTVRVWDGQTGRLLQVLRPPVGSESVGAVYAASMSPDGNTIAVGGNFPVEGKGFALYLFDRPTGTIRKGGTLSGLEAPVHQVAWSADGHHLAIGLRQEGLRVFTSTLQFVGADPEYNDAIYGADFARDGRLAVASLDGAVRLYRIAQKGLERLARKRAPGGRAYSIAFSPDGRMLAVGSQDAPRADLLDAATLETLHTATAGAGGNLGRVAWATDGGVLYVAGSASSGGRFPVYAVDEAGHGTPRATQSFANTIFALASSPDGGVLVGTGEPSWAALDASGAARVRAARAAADFRDAGDAFRVSAAGDQISFPLEPGGRGIVSFDYRRGELKPGVIQETQAPVLTGDVSGWKNSSQPSLRGRPLPLAPNEVSRALAYAPDASRFVLGSDWYLRAFDAGGRALWEQRAPASVWALNVTQNGRWVVAGLGDGTVRWYRLADGREQLALYPAVDGERWLLWSPAGYYDTSVGAEGLIGWHMNRAFNKEADFFSVGRFRSRFYRPDVVQKVFQTADVTEALRLADAKQVAPTAPRPAPQPAPEIVTAALPPVVELKSDNEIETSADTVTVRFAVRSPAESPASEAKVRVNGRLVRSVTMRAAAGTEPAVQQLTVALPPENAEILVFARNRNGSSEPAVVRVKRQAAKPDLNIRYGTLYVLAIGISKYRDANLTLDYPAKDARDFVAMATQQGGGLYERTEIRVLTDGEATRDAVLAGLKWLREKVGDRDVGVLFLAGHGVLLSKKYFFAPVDIDTRSEQAGIATGVATEEIQRTLMNLKGKAIFFVDTCHSGFAIGGSKLGSPDMTGTLNELDEEKGVYILASAGGRQQAQESSDWNNGAFTKALIEGLQGRADYARDGTVTPSFLNKYVYQRVRQLTDNQQTPKVTGGYFDDPIAIIKN